MGQGGPQGQNSTLGGNPTQGNSTPAATGLSQSAAQAGVTRTPAPTYSASAIPASPGGKGGSPGGPASAPSFSSAPPASAPSFSSAPAPSPYAAALQAAIGGYMPRSPGGAPPPMAPPPMAPPPMAPPPMASPQGQPPRAEAVSNFDARNARIQRVRDDQAAGRAGLAAAYNNTNGYYP